MNVVSNRRSTDDGTQLSRVERALRRCLEWSRTGRHLKIIAEVDRALPVIGPHPRLEAQLLIWKAQAHLALGEGEPACSAADRSWRLDPAPHSCHLLSNSLAATGRPDDAEKLLRSGCDLFPEAYHLPVQLAILLSEQGRHPEALDTIDKLVLDAPMPDDLQVFLLGLHANLLAAVGRWGEADGVLRDGRYRHPESGLLEEAHHSLADAWDRFRAQRDLARSWREGLAPLHGVYAEVDEGLVSSAGVNELDELVALAARRLWRAYLEVHNVRPQSPEPWSAALLVAVLELDGSRPNIAVTARRAKASVSTTRTALARIRRFLAGLEPNLARRAFAALSNPRLDPTIPPPQPSEGSVVPFVPR
jgi:tetratricopeptide (TPR) repeat protein